MGLLGNAETGEEGTAAVASPGCVQGSLSKPPAIAPSANQDDDAPGWVLHHILRKLPLYMHFHQGPEMVLFNHCLFHFQISEDKLGDSDVMK